MNQSSRTSALYQISRENGPGLPGPLSDGSLDLYPAMKLGVESSVRHYADKLCDFAETIICQGSEHSDWILTAPPFHVAPSAANLLSWQIRDRLAERLPDSVNLLLVDLKLPREKIQLNSESEFQAYYNYSKNSVEQRVAEREKLHGNSDDILDRASEFRGKSVIVINDIKVTGTQQKFMQASFDRVGVASVDWLYIVEVETAFGISHPEIEHEINHLRITSVEDFAETLATEELRHTSRCLSRFFSCDLDEFKQVLERLGPRRSARMRDLVKREGRHSADYFKEKCDTLAGYSLH